jgi:translation initiation factor 2 beta subunit (eIF-2beta)/eIF-5
MAILARKIFEEYNTTGKISDYKRFVLQTPATSQWYIDDVIRYTNELVKISLCWLE